MFETIVALATPPAKSALAIIRVSGEDCFRIVSNVFTKDLKDIKEKGIHFGYIKNGSREIDQVVLLTYVAPHSFTGENSVEIISHGSMLIVNQIIQLLLKNGCRMATNGEFSSRAYLNGKIDLVQAEAINDMINATTLEAKDLSMESLKGQTSKLFKPIKDSVGEILSHIEVNIDYPEYEDIEQTSKEEILEKCSRIIGDINELVQDGESKRIYQEGVKVAIVGKPNVGKSSLLNSLIREDKAIVTDIAGTTRDVVEGDFNLSGVPVHLYDTAGIRDSSDVIEQIGISKAKKAVENADLILFVVDETGFDNELYSMIKNQKHLVVFNKVDITGKVDDNGIHISAKNNDVGPLLLKMREVLNIGDLIVKPTFNNTRQLGILKQMVFYLSNAIEDTKNNQPIDLISVSIMAAYNCALDLLGQNNKNDLTDEIFSRFCVGK